MMKKKNGGFYVILSALGLALLIAGLVFIKLGVGEIFPYIFVGMGCGVFGHGVGELAGRRNAKAYPEYAKKQEILKNDERNLAIMNNAKARGFDAMIYVFGALFIAFALMNVELKVILLSVGAYLFVCAIRIYYGIKYDREM